MINVRWIVLLLMLLLCTGAAAEDEFVDEFPAALRFEQDTQTESISKHVQIKRVYPDTASDEIDAAMRELIDAMTERNRPLLPTNYLAETASLEVGAVISRSGESALSFLTIAEYRYDRDVLSAEFETRVYDALTGKMITMEDIFREDAGAYDYIASEIRRQLSEAFIGTQPDEEALSALCDPENIRKASFTLGAAQMTLTYRADDVYPQTRKASFLHVRLDYPTIREMMTPYGLVQTDNSRYRMVALTYDDGGARGITRTLLDELRNYGARATFFVVGKRIASNHDIMVRQQNANHSLQSHTFTHSYPDELKDGDAHEEKEKMIREMNELIGVVPTMMCAPGGRYNHYQRQQIGYPLMQWSLASWDSGNTHYDKIAQRVISSVKDGDVVLLHDINEGCPRYSRDILRSFEERGIMCVTVEELFIDAGVALEAGHVYQNPYRIVE